MTNGKYISQITNHHAIHFALKVHLHFFNPFFTMPALFSVVPDLSKSRHD